MYHRLLANRYLTSRVIPLVAVAAVGLCVALVIIVVSVMSGFLERVRDSGRVLIGDVVLTVPLVGLVHYEEFVAELESDPAVGAVAPVVDGWGLLRMPYPLFSSSKHVEQIQFWGVDPERFAAVTGYADTLYWRPPADAREEAEWGPDDFRRTIQQVLGEDALEILRDRALDLRWNVPGNDPLPGAVLGLYVSQGNVRQPDGSVRPGGPDGDLWMPQYEVILSTIPTRGADVSPELEKARFRVVNEMRSGIFLIDDNRIVIPIDRAQQLTGLGEQEIYDEMGRPTGRVDPARATMLLIRASDGVTPEALKERVIERYTAWRETYLDQSDRSFDLIPPSLARGRCTIQTWIEQQARFLGPVEKERELLRTLFSLVYLVCAGLVLAIFWAIVYEKTRDIGVLRAVGASRFGVSLIFLRYGLFIGVLGAVVGAGIAWLVVHNINAIHDAMGNPPIWLIAVLGGLGLVSTAWAILHRRRGLLPVSLGGLGGIALGGGAIIVFIVKQSGGIVIWNAETYYFDRIPSSMDAFTTLTTMGGAVIFSVLGAYFPAAKAADTDPVRALRYE